MVLHWLLMLVRLLMWGSGSSSGSRGGSLLGVVLLPLLMPLSLLLLRSHLGRGTLLVSVSVV
jgi:hypothetical protein